MDSARHIPAGDAAIPDLREGSCLSYRIADQSNCTDCRSHNTFSSCRGYMAKSAFSGSADFAVEPAESPG